MAGETIQTPDLLKEPPVKDEFKGKVAFVTGAGSGLGRATGIVWRHRDWSLALLTTVARGCQSLPLCFILSDSDC